MLQMIVLEVEMKLNQSKLLEKLNSYFTEPQGEPNSKELDIEKQVSIPASIQSGSTEKFWHISLRFKLNTFRDGLEPYSVLKYLNRDGNILNLITITSLIPDLDLIEPESCYTGFEIEYKSDKDMSFILQAFEFVEYDCDIQILSPTRTFQDILDFFNNISDKTSKLLRILLVMGTITRPELKELNKWKRNKSLTAEESKVEAVTANYNNPPKEEIAKIQMYHN